MKNQSDTPQAETLSRTQLVDAIISKMKDHELSESSIEQANPFINALSERIHLSHNATMLFAVFFNYFTDSRIRIRDIANFYDASHVKILTYWPAITEMVKSQMVNHGRDADGEDYYSIPQETIDAIREDREFAPKTYTHLTLDQWVDEMHYLFYLRDHNKITFDRFHDLFSLLIKNNPELVFARELATIKDEDERILFAAMADFFIQDNDEQIVRDDLENIFENKWEMRTYARMLEAGLHPLQQAGLVEFGNNDGQVVPNMWKLTEYAKERFLVGIDLHTPAVMDKHIQSHETIIPKHLYFNASVAEQVRQLETLLHQERFEQVQDNLTKHGMRRGFACIFYGAPGTGKTETVLQLARKTGRDIMMVDVPNLRSKWVGDTEKNTKAIFERYRSYCKKTQVAPILLFNEADAILCKRKEGAENSVDKMENAMQNIILQEMETLEGIMIATTNLTGNLDTAFERRFLYKIEFPKPSPDESKYIWQSMLPELSDSQAYELAKQYSFSGGQIENIARKQLINAVLFGTDKAGINSILEACKNEQINTPNARRIGFC